ncbi:MAG: FecR family protein [Deltaproteobacteria bacterium]|jgi:hypothetical protein|nr:FecR family protein [Deltaproteobacteria bacterium]
MFNTNIRPTPPAQLVTILALAFSLFFGIALSAPGQAWGAERAGDVIAARKTAWAERNKDRDILASKSQVFVGDTLVTDPAGKLQVLFRDDSVLMLAPDSRSTVSEYIYAPGQKSSFAISVASGLTRLISGGMATDDPTAIRMETPTLRLGIKGTDLTVRETDDASSVYLTHGGPVEVTDRRNGRQYTMSKSGTVMIFSKGFAGWPEILPMNEADWNLLASLTSPSSSSDSQPGLLAAVLNNSGSGLLGVGQGSGGVIGQQHQPDLGLMHLPDLGLMQPPDLGPVSFSGTYYGALTGTDTLSNIFNGSFTIGIADLAGNARVNSVNMNASSPSVSGSYWSAVSSPGFSALVSSNGAFDFEASPAYPNQMILTDVGDGLSVRGQADGHNLNLDWQVMSYDSITGTGQGTKQ